jgi:membrane fusion protein (multidrug efflux system)
MADEDSKKTDSGGNQGKKAGNGKQKRTGLIFLALLVIVAIGAIPVYSYYAARESTDDAQVDGHVVPISPRIAGTLISIAVDDNQEVKEGQELVRLDPRDYQVALEQAKADLADAQSSTLEAHANVPITAVNSRSSVHTSRADVAQSQAALASAEQQVNANKARLDSAKSRLAEAEANNVKAQRDLERYKALVDKEEVSTQQYDSALAQAQANKAEVDSARASIIEAQRNVDAAVATQEEMQARRTSADVVALQSVENAPRLNSAMEARLRSMQAKVLQRQAQVDQAQLNLGYTILRAPVAGVVSKKTAEPGQRVQAGEQLMSLVPLEDVWVTANFKETQLKRMRVGQRVEIEVDAFGGRKYVGHIDSIAAASGSKFSLLPPENATGNYVKVVQRVPVKIVLDKGQNIDHLLRPGMSVTPVVLLDSGR